jgi:beta-phosphoglucomutase
MQKLKFNPKAIIFDMDGVIVDSMPYHFLAWYEALRPWGIRVTCFDVFAKEGEKWQKSLYDFLKKANIKPEQKTLQAIFKERQRIFKKYFRRFIFKGAEEFLIYLKNNGHTLGLVTGTPTDEIKTILPIKIRNLFTCIIAGDLVKKGKPHPEPYLKAAKYLKLKPSECIVVENAPYGIESAKKAGMFCIAITTSLPKEYLKKADIIVEDLETIEKLINKSCTIHSHKKHKE